MKQSSPLCESLHCISVLGGHHGMVHLQKCFWQAVTKPWLQKILWRLECKISPNIWCLFWSFRFKLHCHISCRRRRPLPPFPPLRELFLLAGKALQERLEKLYLFLFHFAVHSSHLQVQWLSEPVWMDSLFWHLRFLNFIPPDTVGFSLWVPFWYTCVFKVCFLWTQSLDV